MLARGMRRVGRSDAVTAFVVLAVEDDSDEKGSFKMCKTELASHKVPKTIVVINKPSATN